MSDPPEPKGYRLPPAGLLYWISYWLFRLVYRVFWRMRAEGIRNVPRQGPVILAANHRSLADPPLVGCLLHRPIYFMAKAELFRFPGIGRLLRILHAFPVRRGVPDRAALRTAEGLLRAGGALVIFPEGGRRLPGRDLRLRYGAGLLAKKTGAAIVPVAIVHSDRLWRFRPLRILYGKPLLPDRFNGPAGIKRITEEAMTEVERLYASACRNHG